MTEATDEATVWNTTVTERGDTVTLYNPTMTYNNEGDVTAYTLDAGSSATVIMLRDSDGETYNSNVEGIGGSLSIRALFDTTESIDDESIIKDADGVYFRVAQGSLRKIRFDDTVIAQRAILRKLMAAETAKIA